MTPERALTVGILVIILLAVLAFLFNGGLG